MLCICAYYLFSLKILYLKFNQFLKTEFIYYFDLLEIFSIHNSYHPTIL